MLHPRLLLLLFIAVLLIIAVFLFFPNAKTNTPQAEAKTINAQCKNTKSDLCYVKQFTQLTKKHDLSYTLATLSELQKMDTALTGCHFIGHVIAGEELAKNPTDWKGVMARIPVNDCTGGFLMGLMEGRKKYEKNFNVNAQSVEQLCAQVKEQAKDDVDETCFHVMGHLLLIEKNGHINDALKLCSGIPEQFWYECYAGVFMENIYKRNLVAHGIGELEKWNKETLEKHKGICNTYQNLAAKACWREISHMFIVENNNYPPDVYSQCSSAPDEASRDECYIHAVGVMSISLRFDHKHFKYLCSPYVITEEMYVRCSNMVVSSLTASSSKSTALSTFCATLPQKYQKLCPQ